jgi:hypothetical protein
MKARLLIFIMLSLPVICISQEECRVLLPELDSVYMGDCKKGLAHGSGEAWGDFHYKGRFKKGLPDGQGTANYPDGTVYDGSWKKGLRNGRGTILLIKNGEKIEKNWIWSKGEKVKEILPPSYKIITKRNISRLRVYNQGGQNGVWFKAGSAGGAASNMEDARLTGSSGAETNYSEKIGYDNVSFPFLGTIKYYAWNKLRTTKYEIFLEIEITNPGNWIVEIQN